MVHYRATLAELIQAINATLGKPAKQDSWWFRAHADFLRAVTEKTHDKKKAYWSEVKGAFINLQCNKCAYCETPMPEGSKALIAYDVEHHRPKSRTMVWPDAAKRKSLAINYQVQAGRSRGYPELAHHPYNYAVSCKVCNSPYKSDFFPILATADEQSYMVSALNKHERPSIPLPIGDWGEDPAEFLTFEGFIAVPASDKPAHKKRAQIVIDFFELNRRPDLLHGRATAIVLAYQHLKELDNLDLAASVAEAQSWVDSDVRDTAPFVSTVRAFRRLYDADRAKALEFVRLANSYVSKKSPQVAMNLTSKAPETFKSMPKLLEALN